MGFKFNYIIIISVLFVCLNLESLRKGKEIYGYIFRNIMFDDMIVIIVLIYMYVKCGEFDIFRWIFNAMFRKDYIVWNIMIIVYLMYGNGEEVLLFF